MHYSQYKAVSMEMEIAYDVKWATLRWLPTLTVRRPRWHAIKRKESMDETSTSMTGLSWRRRFSRDVNDVSHSILSFQEHFDVQYLTREQEVEQRPTNELMEKVILWSFRFIMENLTDQYNINSAKAVLKFKIKWNKCIAGRNAYKIYLPSHVNQVIFPV